MKIVVLSGYGVFGAKLVELLVRDGKDVIVAGRSAQKVRTLAKQFGAWHLVVDRAGDLAPLWAANPDAVVDAAGPLPLPRFALPQGVAREYTVDGAFHFDVALKAPLTGGMITHYRDVLAAAS